MNSNIKPKVVKFVLRMEPALHKRVIKIAKKNRMSMNSLIHELVSQGLTLEARSDSAKLDKIIELIEGWSDADPDT